jgi:UDP-N-acetylmuramyl pentapeptide phosphotransferase/UDP-N-acetylglucosamine-1-phosphate transferase
VAFGLLSILLRYRGLPLDRPNERSLHSTPVPRVGGLALVAGVAGGWMFVADAVPWTIWAPASMVFAISCIDDVADLSAAVRLAVHLVAAAMTAFGLGYAANGLVATLIAVLAIAWMTNLFNFMDGSDGLAGGMALFGFGAYALAAWIAGDVALALACGSISAAAGTFLWFNFYPARVFLGDAGSIPLGFLAASLGMLGWIDGLWPIWFPLVVFSAFVVDATVTLLRRLARGERVWQAHREHCYQRLVRQGWGHRRTALVEYSLMIACAGLALIAVRVAPLTQTILVAGCALSYLGLLYWVDRICRTENEALK